LTNCPYYREFMYNFHEQCINQVHHLVYHLLMMTAEIYVEDLACS